MYNQDGRDIVVEEDSRNATRTVRNLETDSVILLIALSKITSEVGSAVLVGVDDPSAEGPELSRNNLKEILEHVAILHGLENGDSVSWGRKLLRYIPPIRCYPMDNQSLPS